MNSSPALLNAERFRREVAAELGQMNAEDAERLCNILRCVLGCLQELDGRLTALEALPEGEPDAGAARGVVVADAALAVVNGEDKEREDGARVSPGVVPGRLPMRTRLSGPGSEQGEAAGGGGQDWVPMACL